MHYIKAELGRVIPWDEAFPNYKFGERGIDKVGFGKPRDSVDNRTSICGEYNSGGRLLEEVGFYAGNSKAFYNIVLVLADKPWALSGDTDCHIVGVMEYLEVLPAGRISGFVNDPANPENDPEPSRFRDSITPEVQYINRTAGHLPWKKYYYHIYYLDTWGDKPRPALTLQVNGHTPKTDIRFPEPVVEKFQTDQLRFPINDVMGTWTPDN